jgi:uncharacterized protein (TIGR00251 family)
VVPRASRTEFAGVHGGARKLRVAAPPVGGAANEAVVRFLAERLGVPRAQVILVSGQSARRKVVEIQGLDPATAAARLGLGSG